MHSSRVILVRLLVFSLGIMYIVLRAVSCCEQYYILYSLCGILDPFILRRVRISPGIPPLTQFVARLWMSDYSPTVRAETFSLNCFLIRLYVKRYTVKVIRCTFRFACSSVIFNLM